MSVFGLIVGSILGVGLAAALVWFRDLQSDLYETRKMLAAVEHEVAIVYDNLTCGKFSKCNTIAQFVIDAVDERQDADEAELRAHIAELEAAIREHHDAMMDNCVMQETDPCDEDVELWSHVVFTAPAGF